MSRLINVNTDVLICIEIHHDLDLFRNIVARVLVRINEAVGVATKKRRNSKILFPKKIAIFQYSTRCRIT